MYGDLCQMTYDNYIRTESDCKAVDGGLDVDQKKARNKFQTGCPMVGGFKYLPSELMKLPAKNESPPVVKQVTHSTLNVCSRPGICSRQPPCPRWRLGLNCLGRGAG